MIADRAPLLQGLAIPSKWIKTAAFTSYVPGKSAIPVQRCTPRIAAREPLHRRRRASRRARPAAPNCSDASEIARRLAARPLCPGAHIDEINQTDRRRPAASQHAQSGIQRRKQRCTPALRQRPPAFQYTHIKTRGFAVPVRRRAFRDTPGGNGAWPRCGLLPKVRSDRNVPRGLVAGVVADHFFCQFERAPRITMAERVARQTMRHFQARSHICRSVASNHSQ